MNRDKSGTRPRGARVTKGVGGGREERREGDEETGKCFRVVVPLARSHCYLTRRTRASLQRRTASEKRRERESIVEVPPNAILSLRLRVSFSLSLSLYLPGARQADV